MANPDNTPTPDTLQEALLNDPEFLQRIVQNALQHILEAEISHHLNAEPYQRTPSRKGYRNGYLRALNPDNSKPESAASSYSSPKTEMAPSGQNSSRSTNATRKPSCYP